MAVHPNWEFILQDVNTGDTVQITNPRGRRVTVDLYDTETASFQMSGLDPSAGYLRDDLGLDLLVIRNNLPIYRGRITQISRDVGVDRHDIAVASVGYKALLDARIILPLDVSDGGTLDFTAVDATTIGWNLIDLAQQRLNGRMNINQGATNIATGVRTRKYPVGTQIGVAIDRLGRVQQDDTGSDVFEWWLEPTIFGSLYQTFSPARGKTNPEFLLDYGGSVAGFKEDINGDNYANVVVTQGDGGTHTAITYASDYDVDPAGAFEAWVQEGTLASQTESEDRGRFLMANQYGVILPQYTVNLRSERWGGPQDLWVGDVVNLSLHTSDGLVAVERSDLRCTGLGFSIDDNGRESIALNVGYRTRSGLEAISVYSVQTNMILAHRVLTKELAAAAELAAIAAAEAAAALAAENQARIDEIANSIAPIEPSPDLGV